MESYFLLFAFFEYRSIASSAMIASIAKPMIQMLSASGSSLMMTSCSETATREPSDAVTVMV